MTYRPKEESPSVFRVFADLYTDARMMAVLFIMFTTAFILEDVGNSFLDKIVWLFKTPYVLGDIHVPGFIILLGMWEVTAFALTIFFTGIHFISKARERTKEMELRIPE